MNYNMDLDQNTTTHALINITERIQEALDNKKPVSGVFDTDHHILLKKLEYYGIRGTINAWFKSYLYNRKQTVIINGHESEEKAWCSPRKCTRSTIVSALY